jgi:single-stranded DNA-binding protein
MTRINTVSITGTLAKPPTRWNTEMTVGGESGATLTMLVAKRVKRDDEWTQVDTELVVEVPGKQGVACAEHLTTGDPVGVSGRLDLPDVGQTGIDACLSVIVHNVDFNLAEAGA